MGLGGGGLVYAFPKWNVSILLNILKCILRLNLCYTFSLRTYKFNQIWYQKYQAEYCLKHFKLVHLEEEPLKLSVTEREGLTYVGGFLCHKKGKGRKNFEKKNITPSSLMAIGKET